MRDTEVASAVIIVENGEGPCGAREGTGRTMNAAEIKDLSEARTALARQRNAIARKLAAIALAPVSMAEDLTRVLLAIEAVDRALADAGQPFMATEA